jgi:hypothetical protein
MWWTLIALALAGDPQKVALTGEKGATVILDNKTLGVLPLETYLEAGVHTFEVVSRTGLTQNFTREIDFASGTPTVALTEAGEVEEDRVVGEVNFFGPTGAKVFVDGAEAGLVPLKAQLAEGSHTIRVELPGGGGYEMVQPISFKSPTTPFNLMLSSE